MDLRLTGKSDSNDGAMDGDYVESNIDLFKQQHESYGDRTHDNEPGVGEPTQQEEVKLQLLPRKVGHLRYMVSCSL